MNIFSSTTKIEERLVINATQRNIPLGGSFELLPLCNMDCKMCFLRLSHAEMTSQGRLRTTDEWLALAEQARDAGLLFLLLTGGEIFLHPDFERLYTELYKMGFFITLNTNGTLINEHIADMLRDHMPRRVNITLYGASDETYKNLCGNARGFSQALNGIKLLQERGVPVKLNGSLTEYNKDDLEAIQTIAKELDIPLEVDSYMFPSGRKGIKTFDYNSRLTAGEIANAIIKINQDELNDEEYQNWLEYMHQGYAKTKPAQTICKPDQRQCENMNSISEHIGEPLPCRAGLSSFWINWKGNMTPCVFMEEPDVPVFETGFDAAWQEINKKRQQMYLPAACTRCERRMYCTVCGACALTETGDMNKRPDYMCAITNEKLRLAHEEYQKKSK